MAYGKVSMFEENSLVTSYVQILIQMRPYYEKLYVLLLPLKGECYHCQDGHIGNQLRCHNSHIASPLPQRYWVVTPK